MADSVWSLSDKTRLHHRCSLKTEQRTNFNPEFSCLLAAFLLAIQPRTWDWIIIADFVLSFSDKTCLHHLCSLKTEQKTNFNPELWWWLPALGRTTDREEAPATIQSQYYFQFIMKPLLVKQNSWTMLPMSFFRVICPLTNRWISNAACLWLRNNFQHFRPRIELWIFVTASLWNKKSLLTNQPR